MKILAAGGGSGGHVTPVLAVLRELKVSNPNLEVYFICDRGFAERAKSMMVGSDVKVTFKAIFAGKLRRYHGVSIIKQILDLPTVFRNIFDVILIAVGFVQSFWHLLRFRPDVVFTKGGFVCLPIGLAAALLKIPLVIHDSDAHPGLTNRILSRYASKIATGAPLENYNYPESKAVYVGIPVSGAFKPLKSDEQRALKGELGLPDINRPLVVVTGGGLGAKRINQAMVTIGKALLEYAAVYHITGQYDYESVVKSAPTQGDYIIKSFIDKGMSAVLGAADVVVTRAGATTMSELAALAKPVMIIPNPMLTGGHQTKNASVYSKVQAAKVIDEATLEQNPLVLLEALVALIKSDKVRQVLGKRLNQFAKPNAAKDTARILQEVSKRPKVGDK